MTRQRIRRLILCAILLVIGCLTVSSLMAGAATSIELTAINLTGCRDGIAEGSYRIVVKDATGSVVNSVAPYATQRLYSTVTTAQVGTGASTAAEAVQFAVGTAEGFTLVVTSIENAAVRSPLYQFECDTRTVSVVSGGAAMTGADDDRINKGHGDLMAALYLRDDSEGSPAIHVYDINSTGEGSLGSIFAFADFEPFLVAVPETNTEITRIGKVTLHALTTSEFQINIGPDIEGKTSVIILDSMPPENIYYRSLTLYGDAQ